MISIDKTGEHFRLIYDVKGRFTVHRITAEEAKVGALVPQPRKRVPSWKVGSFWVGLSLLLSSPCVQYKLCKVRKIIIGTKGIPHLITHDARTIRYPDPLIKVNDTVRIDLESTKITDYIKFDTGAFPAAAPPPSPGASSSRVCVC